MSTQLAIAAPALDPTAKGMWEITFTSAFKEDLTSAPRMVYEAIDRLLNSLREDPFARIPSAKRLKDAPNRFRSRIADRFRLLYQVFTQERRVILVRLGDRQNIYRAKWPDPRSAGTISADQPVSEIASQGGSTAQVDAVERVPSIPDVEPDLWLSEEELFLLRIPDQHWQEVVAAGNLDALTHTALPAKYRERIEDYLTNPASSQLGRLYELSAEVDADRIAAQPLEAFLLALDPEQKRMVQLQPQGGPYLIKGGPGTGKTLVGLYRLKRLLESGVAGTSFACLTYTNSLVGATEALLHRLLPHVENDRLHVSTLDKLTYDLATKELGRRPFVWKDSATESCIQATLSALSKSAQPDDQAMAKAVGALGVAYVREEIDHVIEGNNLCSLEEYSKFERSGRRRAFSQPIRGSFWGFYEAFKLRREKARACTWGSLRQLALLKLKRDPDYPRFDFLFVDEVQDLSRIARQICIELVKDTRFLFLTADTAQSIFIHPPSWAGTDPRLNLRGRSLPLCKNYRTTRQIADAIAPLRGEPDDGAERSGPSSAVFTGEPPHWQTEPVAHHPAVVAAIVKRLTGKQGVNPGQIAIVLRESKQVWRYRRALSEAHVPAHFVEKESPISLQAAHVHLLLAHSSKGLEFPFVIVPEVTDAHYPFNKATQGARDDSEREEVLEKERRLLYVALSRACVELYLIADVDAPSRFVRALRSEDWS